MRVADYKFQTSNVTICEPDRFERLYDGTIEKIPDLYKTYRIYHVVINRAIDNTYMEVEYVTLH